MTNTIQFKKSNVTAAPATLAYGEPAWANSTGRFYIGDNTSTPILVNPDFFEFPAGRNGNISSNQSLRRQDGMFISTNPYPVPYDGVIYCVSAERENVNLTRTWDLVVEVNTTVVHTVNVTSGNRSIENDGLAINVNKGDSVVIYFRNASASINKPGGVVYGKRRG